MTRPGAGRCGTLYLLRCDRPCQSARHDSGAHALVARLAGHGTSGGARMLHAQRQAGGTWHITRTWPGGKHEEPAIKQWKQAPKLCPDGTPGIQRGAMVGVARAAERVRVGQARRYAAAEPEPGGDQVLTGYAARGRQDAARFLSYRRDATVGQFGRAAAKRQTPVTKATAHPETTPGRAHSPRSSPQPWNGCANHSGRKPRPPQQEGTDVAASARPTQPATEWHKGALTAHDLVIRQIEARHSADHIAGAWEQALASYDDATATDAEREWHAGAAETAADMIQTLRDTERAETEQAQADRGTCDCGYPACRSGALPSALQARPAQAVRDAGGRQAPPEAEAEGEAG